MIDKTDHTRQPCHVASGWASMRIAGYMVAGIVAAGLMWMAWPAGRLAAVPGGTTMQAPPRPAMKPAPMLAPIAIDANVDDAPVAIQVERLVATHDPQKALDAYWLIRRCFGFNAKHDADVYDDKLRAYRTLHAVERQHEAALCGGLTERMYQARLDYLAQARDAGLPGTAWDYAMEGPFGDPSALKTRQDDPLVMAWKATTLAGLTRAADAGDLTTLMVWSIQLLNGSDFADKNPTLAYRYMIAFGMIASDKSGPTDLTAQTYADGSPMMNGFQFGLTPEQRVTEQAEARRIADEAKRRRRRNEARQPAAIT